MNAGAHCYTMTLTPQEDARESVKNWLAGQQEAMLALLEQLVNIDSFSRDEAGIGEVAETIALFLQDEGITAHIETVPGYGPILRARIGQGQGAPVFLTGHMDTVFPKGTVAQRPFSTDGLRAYGPGVADMKSGLVLNVFVLIAMARYGAAFGPVELLMTCDEEIGSPATRETIMQTVKGARAVFNAEPARANGNVVTSRKGNFLVEFGVKGVAAHSGINFAKGASAIDALARKIIALHALTNDPVRGITSNVGVIAGGIVPNMVAPFATAGLDVRYGPTENTEQLRERIRSIIEEESTPGTQGYISDIRQTTPMRETPAFLLQLYQDCAQELGFSVEGEFTGGAADSGLTSLVGVPTLCATGPVGGGAHTEQEYCEIATIVPRTQAVALATLALLQQDTATHPS